MAAGELAGAALGWELELGHGIVVRYLLGADAPYGNPAVRLVTPAAARLTWRHVEADGAMCLLPPGRSWAPLVLEEAVALVLRAIFAVVETNLRNPAGTDPVAARHRWVTGPQRIWSLFDPDSAAEAAVAGRAHRRWFVAATRGELDTWLSHRELPAKQCAEARVVRIADISELPTDLASLAGDQRAIVEAGGIIVWILSNDSGPLLFAARLDSIGALARLRVDRADRGWIHERGGAGLSPAIAGSHVAIVGCGSLGSGVADLLARAGVGRLTLIDPEALSWDNVARHVLGGESVGRHKAEALARRLGAQLPAMPAATGHVQSWQRLAAEQPAALAADLVLSTTAAWPEELGLAEWCSAREIPLILGWVEGRAAAGHALSLQGQCLACHFSAGGRFLREVAIWEEANPVRLADACHEFYLPYGYADIVPVQGLIARLALAVLGGTSTAAAHWALVPSPAMVESLGAACSPDWVRLQGAGRGETPWSERHLSLEPSSNCWLCGAAG